MSNRTHQAFLYPCDATCARTEKHYSDLNSCSARTRQNQNRGIMSVFRQAFGKLEGSPTNQVNTGFMRYSTYSFYSSASNLKDPLAIQPLEWGRSGGYGKPFRQCIPCCIPNSPRGQANYMLRNEYSVWCCSRTLCSHPRRKSTDVWLQIIPTTHDCPVLFALPVLCPFSIASY